MPPEDESCCGASYQLPHCTRPRDPQIPLYPVSKCSGNCWTRNFAKFRSGFISHSGLKMVWEILHEFETRNIPWRKVPAAKSPPPVPQFKPEQTIRCWWFSWGKRLIPHVYVRANAEPPFWSVETQPWVVAVVSSVQAAQMVTLSRLDRLGCPKQTKK